MCGILGVIGNDAKNKALNVLETIKTRGIDSYGAFNLALAENQDDNSLIVEDKYESFLSILKTRIEEDNISIMQALHSIVGYSPQPLVTEKDNYKFIFSGNHEIYNWKELNLKYDLDKKSDGEVLFHILANKTTDALNNNKNILETVSEFLEELDGTYAFSFTIINKKTKETDLIIGRDILGIKPIWYIADENKSEVSFSSEKKGLYELYKTTEEQNRIFELNPRKLVKFNFEYSKEKKDVRLVKVDELTRKFFSTSKQTKESKEEIIKKLEPLLTSAIEKRVPDRKFGVLFSGGIDSSFIAYNLQKLGKDFVCYTTAFTHPDLKEADDLVNAKRFAKDMSLNLEIIEISMKEVEKLLPDVVNLIEETNVVKVSVGLTMLAAIKQANKDGVKVIFSGLGSEEIFAGYKRHRDSLVLDNVNEECLSGLRKMYERDCYRDDVLSMNNQVEIRFPFLDKDLTKYALKIPAKYKITEENEKMILRDVSKKIGMDLDICSRRKKAAQYGSNVNKAIVKVARKNGFKHMSEYIKSLYKRKNLRVAALFSGGKDSTYAAQIMSNQNYDLKCFVSLKSKNKSSYMFHTPNIDITRIQAKAAGIPLIVQETEGKKEEELTDLRKSLKRAKEEYGVEGVVSGAVHSNYQRERVEVVCDELGLKIFSPLWHKPQDELMKSLVKEGFDIRLSSIAAYGLDKSWFGRKIDSKANEELDVLNKKIGLNQAGEGGEYESLVLDCPLFKKRIEITESDIIMEDENTGNFIVKEAILVDK